MKKKLKRIVRLVPRQNFVSAKRGASPGTLIHTGTKNTEPVRIALINYGNGSLIEKNFTSAGDLIAELPAEGISWINVDGVHDTSLIRTICDHFSIHPLVQEDIVNVTQRAKLEDYGSFLFLVAKASEGEIEGTPGHEQISLLLGRNFVISFQERPGDSFDPVRARLRNPDSRMARSGADFLAYALLDAVVDYYFTVLEEIGNSIDATEEELLHEPDKETLGKIYSIKRRLIRLRECAWPMRELAGEIVKAESPLLSEGLNVYLRDLYDHSLRVINTIDTDRDMVGTMTDLYLNRSSVKLNEVMKVLAVISTIFMPLTFIVGVYGMNFDFMPELHKSWGYPMILGSMLLIVLGQIIFFKWKKWL